MRRSACVLALLLILFVGCAESEDDEFSFEIKGNDLIVGERLGFSPELLGGYELSRSASCYSDGCDMIYRYNGFELETYTDGDVEILRVVRILDILGDAETGGIAVGENERDVTLALGNDFERVGEHRIYHIRNGDLRIFFDDGRVERFEWEVCGVAAKLKVKSGK